MSRQATPTDGSTAVTRQADDLQRKLTGAEVAAKQARKRMKAVRREYEKAVLATARKAKQRRAKEATARTTKAVREAKRRPVNPRRSTSAKKAAGVDLPSLAAAHPAS